LAWRLALVLALRASAWRLGLARALPALASDRARQPTAADRLIGPVVDSDGLPSLLVEAMIGFIDDRRGV
jgi:hypothetical protein